MIKAVIFDLDDTLYPEIEYVKSGCIAIARYLSNNDEDLYFEYIGAFKKIIKESCFNVIDRFCAEYSDRAFNKKNMLDLYRSHNPKISLYTDALPCLDILKKSNLMLALVTDGRPYGQHNKINALGIDKYFNKIIVTDELGGIEYRKPASFAYDVICNELNVSMCECLAVGDNPQKDFYLHDNYGTSVLILRKDAIHTYNDDACFTNVDIVIDSLLMLPDIVKSLNIVKRT